MNDSRKLPLGGSTIVVVLACVVFDVALHRLGGWAFHFDYFENGLPRSALVKAGIFPIAAILGFTLMFGFVALLFFRSRAALGGSPLLAGARFFLPIALIMFFGVLESAVVFPTPFKAEIVTAAADAVPFLLLGGLLSRLARPGAAEPSRAAGRRAPWQSMFWVALFFLAGRYLVSYPILQITSGYLDRAAETFAWTAGAGLSMGAFYWLAGPAFFARTPGRTALRVGVLAMGAFWLMVQLFYALIFAVSVSDLVLRGVADVVYLLAGIYGFERSFRRPAMRTALDPG